MLDTLLEALAGVDAILWGPWTMGFLAGVAVWFTVRSGFFQVTGIRYIYSHTVGRIFSGSPAIQGQRMTPFQAAATSLAGTVGMGNMAGVATALSVGGAGAIFWMWVLAFFGMMSKTVEITLGVYYRERGADGGLRGGPQATIRRGLGWTPLALLFSAGMPATIWEKFENYSPACRIERYSRISTLPLRINAIVVRLGDHRFVVGLLFIDCLSECCRKLITTLADRVTTIFESKPHHLHYHV